MRFHLGRFYAICFLARRNAVLGQRGTSDDAESEHKCNAKLGVHCVSAAN
jgi:hypothetical protein